jgi:hypothetical protein
VEQTEVMLVEWVGGWASHALAFYLGSIAGLIGGVLLSWYGEDSKRDEDTTTPEGGQRGDRG